MTSMMPRLCPSCVHWNVEDDTCTAFPRGVPMDIMLGGDHREPRPGDEGVVFQQKPGKQSLENLEYWRKFNARRGSRPAPAPRNS